MAFASDTTTASEPHRALLLRICAEVTDGINSALDRMGENAKAAVQGRLSQPRDALGRFAKRVEPQIPSLLPADHSELDAAISTLISTADLEGADRQAREAQSLHMRRELHQALHYGFALLDALDLPPLALDVIDDAIATLDAIDGDADLEDGGDAEPSLGAPENHPARWHIDMDDAYHAGRSRHPLGDQTHWSAGGTSDREGEHDGREHEAGYDLAEGDDERCASGEVDQEYSCGWTAKVSQIHLGMAQDDCETTALERHGKGFIRSGHDDAEDDELGGEHGGELVEWMFGPKRNAEAERQNLAAWLISAEASHV